MPLLILGASGSGTTTLAARLACAHLDTDAFSACATLRGPPRRGADHIHVSRGIDRFVD